MKKYSPAIFVLLYILTAIGVYQIGLKNGQKTRSKGDAVAQSSNQNRANTTDSKGDEIGAGRSQLPPGLAPATSLDLIKAQSDLSADLIESFSGLNLNDILSTSDPVDRLFKLTGYLKNMDESNVDTVIDAFEKSEAGYRDWELMMNTWSNFDPKSAMTYLAEGESLSSKEKGGLAHSVVKNWAKSDPMRALEFVQSNEIGYTSSGKLSYTALATAMKTDLNTAIQMTSLIQDEKTRNYSTAAIANEYYEVDPVGAKFWAESIEDPGMKRGALEKITREMSNSDPYGALEYAMDQFGENIPFSAALSLSKNLSKEDPAFALEYASGIENDKTRQYAMAQAVGEWAKDDPVGVAEFLNSQPSSAEWDAPVAAFARNAFDQDPSQAMEWAQSISNNRLRSSTIGSLYRDWSRKDRDAAQAWARTQKDNRPKSGK